MPRPRKTPENAERGAALKAVRTSRHLTQLQVAQRIGIAETTYAQHEQGYVAITALKVPGLAAALGVSLEDLARALRLEDRAADLVAYEAGGPGRLVREQPTIYPSAVREALATLMPPEAADIMADVIQDVAAMHDRDQAFTLEAMTDLVAGRRMRGRRPRS